MDVVISQPTPDQIKVLPHHQYRTADHISPSNVAPSPLDQFRVWFKQAIEGGAVDEPEAMNLSTATPTGIPSARIVLLKQVDSTGFVFFTNYTSRKSKELEANPHAALAFYWREVHRSVRVVGRVEKLSREESEEYFQSRPLGSQLGAWASKQSTIIGEDDLQNRLEKVKGKFHISDEANGHVPTPDFWGGWRVIPDEVEFWCGKPSRLHDRVQYIRNGDAWDINRLSP
ncbi:pyridoxamine 5'-phosphate oxidase [Panaeolus papilionaceus]|nr:pyridoxamine 5'-phosphate oxidase [Panaeolus papilionaceus]